MTEDKTIKRDKVIDAILTLGIDPRRATWLDIDSGYVEASYIDENGDHQVDVMEII